MFQLGASQDAGATLKSLEVVVDEGPVRIEPTSPRLRISGAAATRRILAENVRFVAAGPEQPSEVGYHAHIEPLPGEFAEPWISPDSYPAIVSLDETD